MQFSLKIKKHQNIMTGMSYHNCRHEKINLTDMKLGNIYKLYIKITNKNVVIYIKIK